MTEDEFNTAMLATGKLPASLAKEAYYVACEKVREAMRLRDEAWAAYERARAEQRQLLPQR